MFGDHAAFIVPAYAATFIVIAFLFIGLKLQYSSRRKELDSMEQSGIKRRATNSLVENSDE